MNPSKSISNNILKYISNCRAKNKTNTARQSIRTNSLRATLPFIKVWRKWVWLPDAENCRKGNTVSPCCGTRT